MGWSSTLGFVMALGNVAGVAVAPRARGARDGVARAAAAAALGLCAVVAPALWPRDWPLVRTVLAFATTASFYRLVEILRHPEVPMGARLATAVYPVISPRSLVRAPRAVRTDAFIVGVAFVVFALGLFYSAGSFAPEAPYAGLGSWMRALVGGASLYFFVDGAARLTEAVAALAGFDLGPLHDSPILARSVSEFWSRRWNRAVHAWLDENAFRPAMRLALRWGRRPGDARRRPRAARAGMVAGVMAAFAASAVLHLVPIWVAYRGTYALATGAFFLVQGGLVLLEGRLRVARWRPARARAWTLGVMFLTSPLFVEPLLQSMGR